MRALASPGFPLAADSLSARTVETPNQRINADIPKKSSKGSL